MINRLTDSSQRLEPPLATLTLIKEVPDSLFDQFITAVIPAAGLEQSKAAVLNSLTSKSGQRTYDRSITDFVDWCCSEPRLAFNRTVVLRYRIYLEQKQYAPTAINLRLAAVRRVAYEAADSGLRISEANQRYRP